MPKREEPTSLCSFSTAFFFFFLVLANLARVSSKSTIEPCSTKDSCYAMLGYTLYADLKVAEVASLFQVDPISVLTANAIDISYPDVENHILPARLFLKIPILCSCVDGIRKSVSTHYKTRPQDTLDSIATSLYGGLVSADQIRDANSIDGSSAALDVGQDLLVPLHCTCFNNTDNSMPAIYMSYVVTDRDTLPAIAARYQTTITDLMAVNAMGAPNITSGDIIAIPLPACASNFPRYASDYGLLVENGSYAITASHCVQCSCGPGSRNLYCMPASLAVSCSSMQCRGSDLMLGNFTVKPSSAGCNVTSCNYDGFVNGTIYTELFSFLQPRCPGPPQFPQVIPPPTSVPLSAPAPAPHSESGGKSEPKSSVVPSSSSLPGIAPSSIPGRAAASKACSLVNPLASVPAAFVISLIVKFSMTLTM